MLLLDIEQYVRERGRASLQEVALHVDAAPEAVEPMLERLVRKGRLHRVDTLDGPRCAGCPGCSGTDRAACVVYASSDAG